MILIKFLIFQIKILVEIFKNKYILKIIKEVNVWKNNKCK